MIVTRPFGETERFMVVANAGNAVEDEKHLKALAADFDVKVEPLDRVFLAIQGPGGLGGDLSRAGIETGSAMLFMHWHLSQRKNWFMSRVGLYRRGRASRSAFAGGGRARPRREAAGG